MASTSKIHVGGPDGLTLDGEADAAITPGHLVQLDTSVDPDLWIPHGTDAGPAAAQFLDVEAYSGDPEDANDPVDDAVADGDHVKTKLFPAGSRVNAIIAANEDIAVGDLLVSAGDGTLREYDSVGGDEAGAVIARAREAATDTAAFRCVVEIIR